MIAVSRRIVQLSNPAMPLTLIADTVLMRDDRR
jgi:hypothetical protein